MQLTTYSTNIILTFTYTTYTYTTVVKTLNEITKLIK